ncbi:phosphoribosyltransferase-like protein [Vibrio parahaemolyticus]
MLSQLPSTQQWLSQFMPEHRDIARVLLDNLLIVSSEEMRNDLKVFIESLATEGSEKAALLPIREVTDGESIYDLEDQTCTPLLQASEESLGSEAFISNLYTELTRSKPQQFLQQRDGDRLFPPSISFLREEKYKHLFLVDDLIGSGDRVVSYLDALLSNRTINSWVSYGFLRIHIVSFMATKRGLSVVSSAIRRRKNITLDVMYQAPSLTDLPESEDILQLCRAYAKKGTRYPLGYKDSAVRVVFTHSAPNNLPSILHQNVYKRYRPDNVPSLKSTQWTALFPRRSIPNQFKQDIVMLKEKNSPRYDLKRVIILVSKEVNNREALATVMNKQSAYIQTLIDLGIRLGLIKECQSGLSVTSIGQVELQSKSLSNYHVEKNRNFYYPV